MGTTVITGLGRVSYPHVFVRPVDDKGKEGSYGVVLLIPKSDTKTVAALRAAFEEAYQNSKGKLGPIKLKMPEGIKVPLKDGDKPKDDGSDPDPAYLGHWVLSANSAEKKPGLVGPNPNINITSPDEFYAGCFARISVNCYAYNIENKNKGIAAGLNNIQKIRDGERLDGRKAAKDEFDDEFASEYGEDYSGSAGGSDDAPYDDSLD